MSAEASQISAANAMPARNRLRAALPAPRMAIAGMLMWGLAMAASAFTSLFSMSWGTAGHIRFVVLLYAAGGALAFPVAWTLARLLSQKARREGAFAAAFVCLGVATIGLTAALYALQYRRYYAEWHAEPFTVTWTYQFVFTGLVALYQFAVLGIRLYFPYGFVALIAAALWFARRSR